MNSKEKGQQSWSETLEIEIKEVVLLCLKKDIY